MEQSTIFAALTPEERAALAKKLQRKLYEPGEILLEPGVVLDSLFLIASGVLSVTHPEGTRWVEILRLGPGDHFGEIALLTGEGAWGRITALTPTVVYELPKKDLAPILEARPQVAHELSRALAERQAAGRTVSSAEPGTSQPAANMSHWFTERLQKLFNLASDAAMRKGRPRGGGRPLASPEAAPQFSLARKSVWQVPQALPIAANWAEKAAMSPPWAAAASLPAWVSRLAASALKLSICSQIAGRAWVLSPNSAGAGSRGEQGRDLGGIGLNLQGPLLHVGHIARFGIHDGIDRLCLRGDVLHRGPSRVDRGLKIVRPGPAPQAFHADIADGRQNGGAQHNG